MKNQLEKALALAKKTGDRLIVFESPESENAFVVMNLEQYEDIIEGCGGDCQCDHDYDLEDDDFDEDLSAEALAQEDFDFEADLGDSIASLTEEEMLDKINRDIALWKEAHAEENIDEVVDENTEKVPEYKAINEVEQEVQKQSRSRWAIRNDVKEAAEEIIEEDRHYLEEVNF